MATSETEYTAPRMHNPRLTSIRGVACLIVAIWHSMYVFRISPSFSDIEIPFASSHGWVTFHQILLMLVNGQAAVVVFFVLSGCVLSLQLEKMGAGRALATFYGRRFLRIYPMIVVSVVTAAGVLYFVRTIPHIHDAPFTGTEWLDQANSSGIEFMKQLACVKTVVNPTLWSLRVEIILSIAFPVIFWASKKPAVQLGMIVIAVAAMFGNAKSAVCQSLLAFVLGASLPRYAWLGRSVRSAELPVLLMAIVTLMVTRRVLYPLGFASGMYVLPETVAAFLIVRAAYFGTVGMRFLESKPLIFLGDISYSYYVMHYQVLWLMVSLFWVITGPGLPIAHPLISNAILAAMTVLSTTVVAWGTYNTIEMPFHALGRRRLIAKAA